MKKLCLLMISIVLLLALFAGCTQNGAIQPGVPAGPTGEKTQPDNTLEDILAGEKPVLKYLGYSASFDPNKDIMASVLEDITGYKVEYSMLPAENANEKLAMEVSSGASYDIIQVSPSQFQQLVGQGALLPLSDLLSQYGGNIMEAIGDTSWKTCQSENGETYAVPYKFPYPNEVNEFIICRKDLLDAANIAIPTTLDEFHEVLQAVKEAYPDLIPFTGPVRNMAIGVDWVIPKVISSAFNIFDDWQFEDGKLISLVQNPRTRDMLQYMRTLYNEELIDSEWVINTTTTVNEKFSSGLAVMSIGNRDTANAVIPVMKKNIGGLELGYIRPLTGSNGERAYVTNESISRFTVIPRNAQNAEHAMNWLNAKQEIKNFTKISIGDEGVHYKHEGDAYRPIMPIFSEERTNANWYINTTDEKEFGKMWLARVRKSEAMWEAFNGATLSGKEGEKDFFVHDIIGLMPPMENITKYNTSLNTMMNDYFQKIIAGANSIDTYDSFLVEWEKAGGTKVFEEVNVWYQNFNK